jgi:succinate dehydrogenase / fumarate reductase iron-sulfur subunit
VSELNIHLHVWRQPGPNADGRFVHYDVKVSEHASFLEMLDILNDKLVAKGEEPIAFDSDCREGICGTCGIMINGVAHGPMPATTTCQLHMRSFKDGDEIWVEPFRARAFPVLRDLVVDRNSLDRIVQSGGFISVRTGSAPEANSVRVRKQDADLAFDAAACIGCGACVAACPNASASLITSAKIGHLNLLPQGQPQAERRVLAMVAKMDEEGFGSCTNHRECEAACPKEISIGFIARMNRDFMKASAKKRPEKAVSGPG